MEIIYSKVQSRRQSFYDNLEHSCNTFHYILIYIFSMHNHDSLVGKVKPNTEIFLPSLTTESYTKCLVFYQAEFSPLHPIHVTASCSSNLQYMK